MTRLDSSINGLLHAFNQGDEDAFKKIYSACWSKVFSDAYSRLKNKEDAKNITQDVFITLWEQRGKQDIQNIPAFLYRLCKHKTLNYILKKRPALLAEHELEMSTDISPAYQLQFKEAGAIFNTKLKHLPPKQRSIFKLRYEENRSTVEIAQELGLSVKTVRNHLGRAIVTLRNILKLFLAVSTAVFI